ncbi:MAG: shikimate kinase AroL [Desulfobulbaceae bacterium]
MLIEEGTGRETRDREIPDRIVLTGFRATGKTRVGELLAARLGFRFVDTDSELTDRMGCSVAQFVRERGWKDFRKLEQELLARLAAMHGVVIATGGGAVMHREEWKQLRKGGLVVWLRADSGVIRERLAFDPVSAAQRPPLTGGNSLEEIERVLAEREPLYREGSDIVIDTGGLSPEEIVERIRQDIILHE